MGYKRNNIALVNQNINTKVGSILIYTCIEPILRVSWWQLSVKNILY